MMIPDEPFNFNHAGAFSNFGDQEVRLRHLLRQHALPTVESGRQLLYVCPICKRPWYKAGRQEFPRLTPEQLAYLGATQHTDVHALHLLPRALCPICSTVYLGGMFSVDAYPDHRGYRFLWESASPRRIQLLAMVCRREGLTLDLLVQMLPETRMEPMSDMRTALAWLETCPFPETTRAYTEEQSQHLAQRCPPGSAPDGSVHLWHGYAWERTPVSAEHLVLLKRWIGRIVFPLDSPLGGGFIGRTLLRWEPGMDENAHKAVLDRPGAPRRWIKTNPAGWFGFDAPGQLTERVVLVEGGFDRLALLAAGFPASTVIALVGTAARPGWFVRSAPQVKGVVLALDADESGKTAMERLVGEFRRAGLPVSLCPPPHDWWGKDVRRIGACEIPA